MNSAQTVDVTIVGGGPVGLFAAFYAGLRGMTVRIIDSLPELGGQLTALYPEKYVYDMPGFPKVLAKDLARAMIEQGTQFEPELVLGEVAESLTRSGDMWIVGTPAGLYPTSTIIVSAGAGAFSPTRLGVEGEADYEGRGLSYGVRDPQSFAGKRVAIVGGGDSACDWTLALSSIASNVTLIHRRDEFRAHEETVRQIKDRNVPMKLFYVVKELHGASSLSSITLENTQTKSTELFELDVLIVNVGFKSTLGPLKAWGMAIEKNQIAVDPLTYETNLENVFAVGDGCTYPGKLKLIATGVGEAVSAVCVAKTRLDPGARFFPGHSSDRDG